MPPGFKIGGYAKSLNFASRTGPDDVFKGLSGNRLRLDGEWQSPRETFGARLIADHEVIAGSFLASQRALLDSALANGELLELDWTLNEKENLLWRHSFYRAYGRAKAGAFDAVAGRQRVAWGQGRLWNPTDVVNPYNPLSVERQERPGSDALDLKWSPTGLSFLEGVYVPRRKAEWEESLVLGRARANWREMDWTVLGGKRGRERIVGMDQASQILEGSLRGEFAYFFGSDRRKDFARGVVSYDYSFSFSRPLYALVEYFYNGIGEKNAADQLRVPLLRGDQPFVGRDYLGLGSTWEVTPLWKAEVYSIVNLDDGSAFAGPQLHWQPVADLEFTAGYQLFAGAAVSEFGRARDIGFGQVQWFF
jgi:hypothetical protein